MLTEYIKPYSAPGTVGGTEINGSQSLTVVGKEGYDKHINNMTRDRM